jgi:hypothetical protein
VRNLRDRVVGNAEEDEIPLVGDGDTALAETCRDGRSDTARTDHLNRFEHL